MLILNAPEAITMALSDYFEHRANYQDTIARLKDAGASKEIIRALPQGRLDLGEA